MAANVNRRQRALIRFSHIRLIALALVLLSASTEALAGRFRPFAQLEPDERQVIIPPYPKSGIASTTELKGAEFRLTECNSIYPRGYRNRRGALIQKFSTQRTVSVEAPARLDLFDARIVNGLVIAGLRVAWWNCFAQAPTFVNHQDFGGVRVLISQNGKLAVKTGRVRSTIFRNRIELEGIRHYLSEQRQAEEQARAAAEQERQRKIAAEMTAKRNAESWAKFTGFFSTIFWAVIALGTLVVLVRYGPVTIAFIRYHLFPHPATRHVDRATQGPSSTPLDANIVAQTLRQGQPLNDADARYSIREVEEMGKKAERETEYLRAREALAKKLAEMEQVRARFRERERNRA